MMEKRSHKEENELREYFAAIPTEPVSDALRERVMAAVRKAEAEKFSLKNEKWGLIAAVVVSALLIGVVVWWAIHYKMIPDMTFDLRLKMPPLDLQGAGIWLMLGVTGLLLLIGESLLAKRFIGNRRHPGHLDQGVQK